MNLKRSPLRNLACSLLSLVAALLLAQWECEAFLHRSRNSSNPNHNSTAASSFSDTPTELATCFRPSAANRRTARQEAQSLDER